MNLGEFIKTEREKRGLTQRELGTLSGLTGSFISRIESGKYKGSSPDTLAGIAAALKLKPAALHGFLYNQTKVTPIVADRLKAPDEIVKELSASLPVCVPVYASIDSKIIDSYYYLPRYFIGGEKMQGIISSQDFEDDIRQGDILLCSRTMKAEINDLILCTSGKQAVIKRSDGSPGDCYVIVQSVRKFRSGVGT
jgi:transcriptional regulator with XRE-family HTH domain